MDEKEFKTRSSRLAEVAKVLEKLPNEIRAAAFDLIKDYVAPHSLDGSKRSLPERTGAGSDEEDAAFFTKFSHDTPADNARLIAANHYRKYGSEPFSIEEVRETASNIGITIPNRVDVTIAGAQEKGNKLFAKAGRGRYKPTVHGETYLKTTYSIKKEPSVDLRMLNDAR